MQVRPLTTAEEFERYARFGSEVYAGVPWWVPPDEHHVTGALLGQSPAAAHARVQAFWAEEDGRILATVTAVVDDLFNRHWHDSLGHLVWFEALPDRPEAAVALLQAASEWLRAQGCTAARFSFLYTWQLPLTIDAYDQVPTLFHTYNPTYYHSYVKDAGFVTESGQGEFRVRFTPALEDRYREMVDAAAGSGVVLRPWDFGDAAREAARFTEVYNRTFDTHWGAPQFTTPEMEAFVVSMKDLLVADFTVFAEVDGQPVGAVLSLPDLNQAFHRLRGLDPAAQADALAGAMAHVDHGVLLAIGVLPASRGRGLNLAMAATSYLAMMARGYRSASYTTVLDINWRSRRTAEKLGARLARNFVVYRKQLDAPARSGPGGGP